MDMCKTMGQCVYILPCSLIKETRAPWEKMADSTTGTGNKMSLKYLTVPESKEVLKKKKKSMMRVCQWDTGANRKGFQWPKVKQFEQKKKKKKSIGL